jgi:GH25 family lysozyme M1 (1,4-beta-N-acetylmuramidase)
MSDVPVCIDISHHQGYPDFDEVRRAGVLGMIHKATEGSSFIDDARAENCYNALQAGLAISTYFWLKPGDGRAQAEFYLSVVDPQPGERCVIDYEEAGCTLTTLRDSVQALLDYKRDLQITVYSGHLLKEQLGDDHDNFLAKHTDLWLAQYTSDEANISWPSGTYPQWSLWQYSESGTIPGIDGCYVDLDNFNGNEAAFLKWINPKGGFPMPVPPPEPREMVNVAVTAPDNISVLVTINGHTVRAHRILRRAKRGPDVLR